MTNFSEHLISDYAGIKKFITGGSAIFTLRNEKTQNRFTYKFKQNQGNPDVFWVYLLCQADNTNDKSYKFLGGFSEDQKYLHSKNAQIKSTTDGVKVIQWFCEELYKEALPAYVKFYHLSHCGRCGKQLTTPDSIINGFGPECLKHEIANGFVKPIPEPEKEYKLTEQQEMITAEFIKKPRGIIEILTGYGKQLQFKFPFT